MQIELPRSSLRLGKEALNLIVLDGRLKGVNLLHLLGNDVQRVHLVVLREQNGEGQAHIAGTGNGNLHVNLLKSWVFKVHIETSSVLVTYFQFVLFGLVND